jgi:hypothetical protein
VRSRGTWSVLAVLYRCEATALYGTPVTASATPSLSDQSTSPRVEGAAQKDESRARSQMQREGSNLQKACNF